MKKVLLASTILAVSAGFAAAEVTLSGSARMGIKNDFQFDPTLSDDTGFTSRARVVFTMAGETDGGLAFGASFRADNAGGANDGTAGEVFISGAFGKLSMGDIDGAANFAVGHVDGVGLTGLSDYNESLFIANGGLEVGDPLATALGLADGDQLTSDPTARYDYSTGGFTFAISATQPSYENDLAAVPLEGEAYAVGVAYTFGDYKVSAGYESLDVNDLTGAPLASADHWILGADATFGAITVKARYGEADIDDAAGPIADFDQYALSATYTSGPMGVTAFVSNKDYNDTAGVGIVETDAIGLGASYDLGGGASVVGGIADVEIDEAGVVTSDTAFDLGVSFKF